MVQFSQQIVFIQVIHYRCVPIASQQSSNRNKQYLKTVWWVVWFAFLTLAKCLPVLPVFPPNNWYVASLAWFPFQALHNAGGTFFHNTVKDNFRVLCGWVFFSRIFTTCVKMVINGMSCTSRMLKVCFTDATNVCQVCPYLPRFINCVLVKDGKSFKILKL